MKKRVLFLVMAFMLVLTGCSNNKTGNEGYSYPSDGNLGLTTIKNNPRVVTDYYLGELLKLDVNVIGANMNYASKLMNTKNIEEIGDSYEKIAALKPDLIVTINKDKYNKYKDIAPTLYIEYGKRNPEEQMRQFGDVFKKQDKAQAWLKQFNDNVNVLRNNITDKNQTYTILKLWDKQIWLYGDNWGHGGYIIYKKLGLKAPERVEKEVLGKRQSYLNISLENLPKYSGSNILAVDVKGQPMAKSKIFKSLPAYKNNRIYYVNSLDFMNTDPYSLDDQVKRLSSILTHGQK